MPLPPRELETSSKIFVCTSRKTHANAGSRSPIRHWCMQRSTLSKCPGVCCTSCIIARGSHTTQTHEIGDKRSHSHLVLMMTCYQFHPVRRMKPNAAIHFHKSRITYDISCPFMSVNRREDGPLPADTGWPNTPTNASPRAAESSRGVCNTAARGSTASHHCVGGSENGRQTRHSPLCT